MVGSPFIVHNPASDFRRSDHQIGTAPKSSRLTFNTKSQLQTYDRVGPKECFKFGAAGNVVVSEKSIVESCAVVMWSVRSDLWGDIPIFGLSINCQLDCPTAVPTGL